MKRYHIILSVAFYLLLHDLIGQSPSLESLSEDLRTGRHTVSSVLSAPQFMSWHSQPAFRELIKQYAPAGELTMVTDYEPGQHIDVKIHLTSASGKPVSNALLYLYQTSDIGWYSDTAAHILVTEGDMRHARLFGYVRTDDNGNCIVHTIRPNGYPKSSLAAHIHIHIWDKDMKPMRGPGELQFEDDPRMTVFRKKQSLEDGFPVAKNSGSPEHPVYEYNITVK